MSSVTLVRGSVSRHPHQKGIIQVWFSYDPEDERVQLLLDALREIPGRRYDTKLRCWEIPEHYLEEALSILMNCCDEVDQSALEVGME